MNNVKENLANNLTLLRVKSKLTQSELAEKLNYTDKSISKWEHGEATPPLDVIKDIADFYGVSVDYLISEKSENDITALYDEKNSLTNKIVITSLAVLSVWLIATIFFFLGTLSGRPKTWLPFIAAVPISMIVLTVFNGIWGKRKYLFIIISVFIWSLLTFIFLRHTKSFTWLIYILGVPCQIATILWSKLKPKK